VWLAGGSPAAEARFVRLLSRHHHGAGGSIKHQGTFGSCCHDLARALSEPPNSCFRVEENGVLYLSVGYAATAEGMGWFDSAVMFCPFCGSELQTRAEIQAAARKRGS
jgi:hypothetical protein